MEFDPDTGCDYHPFFGDEIKTRNNVWVTCFVSGVFLLMGSVVLTRNPRLCSHQALLFLPYGRFRGE